MSGEKPSNPKDVVGSKKAPMSTISAPFLLALGNAMLEGSVKYGRHNYRAVGVRSSVYYDAAMRHLMAYWEGQDLDPESGEHHLIKAAACMAVVFDSIHRGNINDDRPPRVKDGWVEEANKRAAAVIEKYPEPKLPYTERDRTWAFIGPSPTAVGDAVPDCFGGRYAPNPPVQKKALGPDYSSYDLPGFGKIIP